MNDDIDPDRQREVTDKGLAKDEEQILSEHRGRYRPHAYRNVFYPPQSGTWKSRVGESVAARTVVAPAEETGKQPTMPLLRR